MIYVEIALALASWALVSITFWMACKQTQQQLQQLDALRADLKVRLQLTFAERFDSERMQVARKHFAEQLLTTAASAEVMGLFIRRGYLDEELAWSTFGFYAVRWWLACKDCVLEERRRKTDTTVFSDFEQFFQELTRRDMAAGLAEPTVAEVQTFLQEETRLQ